MRRQYTLWISAQKDAGTAWFLGALALLVAVVTILNLGVPASSAFHVSSYGLTLVGKYLCYAVLALAVDLIWGYCGILSLGHAAFFSLGGYAMGMYLMREIGPRGVYGDPILPDFMVFLNWKSLPWFWYGFNHFAFALLMVVVAPGLLALAFGWFAFRSRVTGVYFSIITQALTYALMLAFFRNNMGFGGNNGFTDFKDIIGFKLDSDRMRVTLLIISAAVLAGSYLVVPQDCVIASRARDTSDPRFGEPHTLLGLSSGILQALGVCLFRRARGHRRRALRAADRHHQSQRVFADQLDRSGDLGCRGRARNSLRGGCGRLSRELRENLPHQLDPRGLVLRAGSAVRAGDAVLAARHCGAGIRKSEKTAQAWAWPASHSGQ